MSIVLPWKEREFSMEQIVIVIPAYEPDRRLLSLLEKLKANKIGPVVLVDDGSGLAYRDAFHEAEALISEGNGMLLTHEANRGKGRALKTAFAYVLNHFSGIVGVVTADSDGQHSVEAIQNIRKTLLESPDNLILGVRRFGGEGIPWKSKFGNNLTEKVFQYLSGIHVSDTQTGLRGIPRIFLKQLLEVKGERFEFEMRMLLECAGKYEITEVAIETIYDSEESHQTHFRPVLDSIKIYKILGEKFFKYFFSSFSSSFIDLVLFSMFCAVWKTRYPQVYIVVATVAARIISAFYNYMMNYKVVFHSEEAIGAAGVKYAILAVAQMSLSAVLVTLIVRVILILPEVVTKIVVDVVLFFASYHIQQRYVFAKK